jgi:hypothetical protein
MKHSAITSSTIYHGKIMSCNYSITKVTNTEVHRIVQDLDYRYLVPFY